MSGSMPTTAYLRESYAREKHPDLPDLIQLRREGFDRWMAEHDRQVAERAWDEGYEAAADFHEGHEKGHWLRLRANGHTIQAIADITRYSKTYVSKILCDNGARTWSRSDAGQRQGRKEAA